MDATFVNRKAMSLWFFSGVFIAQITLRDGRTVDLLESHTRADCERACGRFDATERRRT